MKHQFVAIVPMKRTTEIDTNEAWIQWMLSSSRLTALVKSTPVHGTL